MKKKHILFAFLCLAASSYATIYKVGPTRTYTLPSQVAGLVNDGDTVNIDAGTYSNCATWNKNNLLLRGVGGMAHIKDVVCSGKGIWNFNGNNITVEYIEFSGAANPSLNGAGIRGQGGKFTVRHCYFHDNENGILCNDPVAGTSDVLVEYSEFANNGQGDGYSHNMYIGNMKSFTLRYCYTHHAKIGHEIKSRAHNNYILYNKITDEASGTASRSIDLPNGGLAIIIGNTIEQGPNTSNSNMFGYGLEGFVNPAPQNVYMVNNTFVNNRSAGSFINISSGTEILKVVNNIFAGPGTVISGTAATLDSTTNWITANKSSLSFVSLGNYDYQLTASSPVINKGSNPGLAGTYSLSPVSEYVHNSNERNRSTNGTIDIGAYEFSISTGIEAKAKQIISVFPNPASEKFEIINSSENVRLLVTNILGEQILFRPINEIHTTIDVSGWISGIYFITVQTNTRITTEKIQVIH
ncbi:MAG: T9SS type A sorting domain-containing protein [Bacteroidota bacterium]